MKTIIGVMLYSVDRNGFDDPGNCQMVEHDDAPGHCGVLILDCKLKAIEIKTGKINGD